MAGLVVKPRARIFHGHDWVYATEIKKAFGDPQPGDVITLKDFRDRPLGSAIYNPAVADRRPPVLAPPTGPRPRLLHPPHPPGHRTAASATGSIRNSAGWSGASPTAARPDRRPLRRPSRRPDASPSPWTAPRDHPRRRSSSCSRPPRSSCATTRRCARPRASNRRSPCSTAKTRARSRSRPTACDSRSTCSTARRPGSTSTSSRHHADVAELAAGKRVLDCFTNQGGFALACAKAGAAKVTAVDISASACEAARRNAELNGLEIDVSRAQRLRFPQARRTPDYDLIILDPPWFTRNKKTLAGRHARLQGDPPALAQAAGKGRPALHLLLLPPRRSASCSASNLVDASVDAKKSLRLVAEHRQRADHPVLLAIPETEYLKGFTVELAAGR